MMKATIAILKNQGTANLQRALHISKAVHKQNTVVKQRHGKKNDSNPEYYPAQIEASKRPFSNQAQITFLNCVTFSLERGYVGYFPSTAVCYTEPK